ncbi:MAG TPA: hypothetical protein VFQ88_03005 [Nevskiaceae bacterium]|nr:hypothetical protein [Nevskiaceae bacterium]
MNKQQKKALKGLAKFFSQTSTVLASAAIITVAVHGGIVKMIAVVGLAAVVRALAAVIDSIT